VHQNIPQVAWFRALDVPDTIRHAIADGNARRLLDLPS
jgi:predicted TIM-barrel fold metal-dependent hydrolase